MRIFNFLHNEIAEIETERFLRNRVTDNIYRGKILASIVIVLEFFLIMADVTSMLLRIDDRFRYNGYLTMYVILTAINVIYLVYIDRQKDLERIPFRYLQRIDTVTVLYATLMMIWGSIVSLMDQALYGQMMVFMVNMITCSVLYLMDNRKILLSYILPVLIVMTGLPYFQSSHDVLVGHYVNLCVFIIISWLASRLIYLGYCNDFKGEVLLQKSNRELAQKIEENRDINMKLSLVNLQLKNLALVDELTGIPNRRSFRFYIDVAFEKYFREGMSLSIIMIDIDYFKQFNDHYGHEAGDDTLVAVAQEINKLVKELPHFLGRWGGEEFICAVVNAEPDYIRELADQIRQKVYELNIPHGYQPGEGNDYISVSIGTGTIRAASQQDVRTAVDLADKALYRAKANGRNCVRHAEDEEDTEHPGSTEGGNIFAAK